MLQRVQTIYLIAGILWTISVGFIGIFFEVDGEPVKLAQNPIITILLAAVVVLYMVGIAMYQNRKAQVNINRINTLYNLLLFGGAVYFAYFHIPQMRDGDAHMYWGATIPILNVVLLFLANRGIMADEELVRSLDRLR